LNTTPPTYLAYVEWFSPFAAAPEPKHLMYRISRTQNVGVITVDSIRSSIHLIPRFGPPGASHDWSSSTVLDQCHMFYVNPFTDRYSYQALV
jgi:hypothetical protein